MLGETEKRVRNRLANGQPTWVNPTERHGKRLWYSASIGTEPFLVEVLLERVSAASAGKCSADLVTKHPVAQLGFKPSALRWHDATVIGDAHQILDARRSHRKRAGEFPIVH